MGNCCCLKKSIKSQSSIEKLALGANDWNELSPEKVAPEEIDLDILSPEIFTPEEIDMIFQGEDQGTIRKMVLGENQWNDLPPEKLASEELDLKNLSPEKLIPEENMWNNLPILPWKMIFKQFSSVKDLQNCYSTCKTWQSIIKTLFEDKGRYIVYGILT